MNDNTQKIMQKKITWRGTLTLGMAALALLGTLAGPQAAWADKTDKGKDGKGPIVGPIVIKPDPPQKK